MNHLNEYNVLFESLEAIVIDVESKLLDSSSDTFFLNNINFLNKSFLVTICAYLESFIKDIAYSTIQKYNQRLDGLGIPTNLTKWSLLDILGYIKTVKQYIKLIDSEIEKNLENYSSYNQ